MNISSFDISSLSLNVSQFKVQALIARDSPFDTFGLHSPMDETGSIFEQMLSAVKAPTLPTSSTPSGLDTLQPFSRPGQNMITVINRLDLTFKAQSSELGQLKNSLQQAQKSAQQLMAIDERSSSADIKSKLTDFIATYDAGVERFAPDLAPGGVLEGSHELGRVRFATRRDIGDPLTGAIDGLLGGMSALGISVDQKTGLASVDETTLDAILSTDTDADLHTIQDFARKFMQTTATLNSADNQLARQIANLDNAIHWIADNRAAVEQEFGPGEAARPNAAFAKAAAAYALIAND